MVVIAAFRVEVTVAVVECSLARDLGREDVVTFPGPVDGVPVERVPDEHGMAARIGLDAGRVLVVVVAGVGRRMRVAVVHADRARRLDATPIVWVVERDAVHHDPDRAELGEGVDGGRPRRLRRDRQPPGVVLVGDGVGIPALAGEVPVLVIRDARPCDHETITIQLDLHVVVEGMTDLSPLHDQRAQVSTVGASIPVEVELRPPPIREERADVGGVDHEIPVAVRQAEQTARLGVAAGNRPGGGRKHPHHDRDEAHSRDGTHIDLHEGFRYPDHRR